MGGRDKNRQEREETQAMRREEAEAVCKECEGEWKQMRWSAEQVREDGQGWFGDALTWAAWGRENGSRKTMVVTGPAGGYGRWRAEAVRSGGRGKVEEEHHGYGDAAMEAARAAAEGFEGRWEDDEKWRGHVRAELEVQAEKHRMELSIIEAALGDLGGEEGESGESEEGGGDEGE